MKRAGLSLNGCIMLICIVGCFFPLLASADPGVPAASGVDTLRILWTVSRYVPGSSPAMSEEEAKLLLHAPLGMTESSITFNGRTCSGVQFRRDRQKTADALSGTLHAAMERLGIRDDTVRVVQTNCSMPEFREYVQLNDGRLIVPIRGWYFILEPMIDK